MSDSFGWIGVDLDGTLAQSILSPISGQEALARAPLRYREGADRKAVARAASGSTSRSSWCSTPALGECSWK